MDLPAHFLWLLSHACKQNTHTSAQTTTHALWINSRLRYQSISRLLSLLMWINEATQYFIYFSDVNVSEWSAACWPLANLSRPFWPSVAQVSFACRCTNAWGWKVWWPVRYDAIFSNSVSKHFPQNKISLINRKDIWNNLLTAKRVSFNFFYNLFSAAMCSISGKSSARVLVRHATVKG